MMFTSPKMQENPPEKAEKHLRLAKNGQKVPKIKKRKKLEFPSTDVHEKFQDVLVLMSGASKSKWGFRP